MQNNKIRVDYLSDLHVGYTVGYNRTNHNKVKKKIKGLLDATLKRNYVSDRGLIEGVGNSEAIFKEEGCSKEEEYSKEEGTILVIAGDVSEYNTDIIHTLEYYARHYDKVFFVYGNHDLYIGTHKQHKRYGGLSVNKKEELCRMVSRSVYKDNIVILDNRVYTYKGKKIAGTSLWYNLPMEEDKLWYKSNSNDSEYLLPKTEARVNEWHERDLEFYKGLEEDGVDLLITHIPPIHLSDYYEPNASYQNMGVAQYNIPTKYWVCGHQHVNKVIDLGDTSIYVNAVGYRDYNKLSTVPKIKTFYV